MRGLSLITSGGATSILLIFAVCLLYTPVSADMKNTYNHFTWNIFSNISMYKGYDNFIVSPFSMYNALIMLRMGTGGQSSAQLDTLLGLNHTEYETYRQLGDYLKMKTGDLSYAVRMFLEKTIELKPDYISQYYQVFGNDVVKMNFKNTPNRARKHINTWVEKETAGAIKDLVTPELITQYTVLALANAVSLDVDFEVKFDASLTKNATFHLDEGDEIQVPTMRHNKVQLKYTTINGSPMVELPYANTQLALYIMMPVTSIYKIEDELQADKIDSYINSMLPVQMSLSMPKFKMQENIEIKDIIRGMGVDDIFSPMRANFTGMLEKKYSQHFFISSLRHGASVDVNEKGTKAAASTVAIGSNRMATRSVTLEINKPFVYFVRDRNTGFVHFMGRYVESQRSVQYRRITGRNGCPDSTRLSLFCVVLATVIKLLSV